MVDVVKVVLDVEIWVCDSIKVVLDASMLVLLNIVGVVLDVNVMLSVVDAKVVKG